MAPSEDRGGQRTTSDDGQCLSSGSVIRRPNLVGLGGLEPPTSRLSSARSNQLSYKPLIGGRRTDNGGQIIRRPSSDVRCLKERETKAARSRKTRLFDFEPLDSEPDVKTCRHQQTKGLSPSVLRPLFSDVRFQKGGDPAAGSPTATLLRLHPSR
jgi:hypothetical protein